MSNPPLPGGGFPATRNSIVEGLRGGSQAAHDAAIERIAKDYWRPIYRYLRLAARLSPAEAEDLTQTFFAVVIERDTLSSFDPERARLRTFLRVLIDRTVSNWQRDGAAQKRGGDALVLRLDFEGAESGVGPEPTSDAGDPAKVFHDEWVRALFDLALDDLREDAATNDRGSQLVAFEQYDLNPDSDANRPSYTEVAAMLRCTVAKVTNDLHAVRKRFRRLLLQRLRETCRDDAEWRDEARELLGIEIA